MGATEEAFADETAKKLSSLGYQTYLDGASKLRRALSVPIFSTGFRAPPALARRAQEAPGNLR